jgi:hypothetical protein
MKPSNTLTLICVFTLSSCGSERNHHLSSSVKSDSTTGPWCITDFYENSNALSLSGNSQVFSERTGVSLPPGCANTKSLEARKRLMDAFAHGATATSVTLATCSLLPVPTPHTAVLVVTGGILALGGIAFNLVSQQTATTLQACESAKAALKQADFFSNVCKEIGLRLENNRCVK